MQLYGLRHSLTKVDINGANDIIERAESIRGRHWCYNALRYATAISNTCSPDPLRAATYSFIDYTII